MTFDELSWKPADDHKGGFDGYSDKMRITRLAVSVIAEILGLCDDGSKGRLWSIKVL